jgi:hypothetical protein
MVKDGDQSQEIGNYLGRRDQATIPLAQVQRESCIITPMKVAVGFVVIFLWKMGCSLAGDGGEAITSLED